MSSSVSATHAADPPVRREEILAVALLLGFAGGYLNTYTYTYTWIAHGLLANAQTANLVFLWVHATAAQWQQAFHFVPPLFAFGVGVVVAAWLRRAAGARAGQLSLLVEIAMLIFVGILHNRVPEIAGALGISMGVCAAFGTVAALLMVLLLCETSPAADALRSERGTV